MLPSVDLSKKIIKPKLYIAKPNKEIIGSLKEAFDIKRNVRIGSINELTFSLPYEIDINHKLVRNPNVDKIKNRYLIKFEKGNEIEWYLIDIPLDNMDDDSDYKSVKCYSLAIQLRDKNIRDYSVVSYNATSVLTDALKNTNWRIGYVDAEFDIKYRSFEVSNSTVLDFVFEIAETFDAVPIFDTNNLTVNFYKLDNIGLNKGFFVSYGKLLKNITYEQNMDEFCTRLKVFGRDGLSIQSVNPTGTNYIEDYSYFMYPFMRDENRNVLSHSDYMSDSLCHALLDYKALVESKTGEFTNLLNQKESLQSILTTKQNELQTLKDQLAVIEDQISVANANQQDTSSLVAQKNAKQAEINAKQAEINTINTNITNVDNQINALKNVLKVENNFTPEQISEWNNFIVEKVFENNNYTDPKDLYEAAKKEFEKIREPKIVVDIDIVNFLEIISEQKNWDKLNLGDIITIKHEKLGINIEAKIIEIEFDYENADINLKISNVREILSDKDRFLKNLYRSISTSTTVDMNKFKWNDAKEGVDEVSQIINNTWDANRRTIISSMNESVEISRKGIIIRDPNDPLKYLVAQHGILALTNDGGNTWKHAIRPDGIIGERIIGRIIAGNNLIITNSAGSFTVDANGVNITNMNLTITRSDNKSKIILNPTDGIKIQALSGSNWIDKFFADSSGNLILRGFLEVGSGNAIFTANNNGIALGSATWSNAPFRVDLMGNAYMNKLTAETAIINNSTFNYGAIVGSSINVNNRFLVDSNGNMTAKNGDFEGTIRASNIYGSYINGSTIEGGQIISNTKITVTTDLDVGRQIRLTGGSSQSIVFSGVGNITFNSSSDSITISARNYVEVDTHLIANQGLAVLGNTFTFNGKNIATVDWVQSEIARLEEMIEDLEDSLP